MIIVDKKTLLQDVKQLEIQNGCTFPFAVGQPHLATVLSAQQLAYGDEVKKIVDICLDIQVISACITSLIFYIKNAMLFSYLCSGKGTESDSF
jgi:hypothetical protein